MPTEACTREALTTPSPPTPPQPHPAPPHPTAIRNQQAVRDALAAAQQQSRQPKLTELLVEPSWREVLAPEFEKPYMGGLQAFLEKEWAAATVYPPQEAVFRWVGGVGGVGLELAVLRCAALCCAVLCCAVLRCALGCWCAVGAEQLGQPTLMAVPLFNQQPAQPQPADARTHHQGLQQRPV